jgi:hypothetical protein
MLVFCPYFVIPVSLGDRIILAMRGKIKCSKHVSLCCSLNDFFTMEDASTSRQMRSNQQMTIARI